MTNSDIDCFFSHSWHVAELYVLNSGCNCAHNPGSLFRIMSDMSMRLKMRLSTQPESFSLILHSLINVDGPDIHINDLQGLRSYNG